jgi:hypothetical protein
LKIVFDSTVVVKTAFQITFVQMMTLDGGIVAAMRSSNMQSCPKEEYMINIG